MAEHLAQRQLDFYNNHDLEGFLSVYSEDVEIYDLEDNKLRYKGKDIMRERYRGNFEKKRMHARLENRMVMGNKVIDYEYVTFTDREPVKAIAIYLCKDDLITKVWFLH